MKKIVIIMVLAVIGILFGCANTELPGKQLSLSVKKDTYEFLNTDQTGIIPVSSNAEWFVSSDQPWCKVVKDGDNILIEMEQNLTIYKRTAKIMISTNTPGFKRPVSVVQYGDVPTLIIDQAEYNFGELGGEKTFEISSNLDWKIKSDSPTWCTVERNGNVVKITVNTSSQTTSRQAKISITTEVSSVDKVILVNQEAASFGVDKSDIDFPIQGANDVVNVTSKVDWTFTTSNSWVTAVKEGKLLKINTAINNGPERTAQITITAGTSSAIIHIKQAGYLGLDLDRQALIAMYNAMNGSAWSTPWNINQPLVAGSTNWVGVTVSAVNGVNRVTSLVLINRGLSGVLPDELGYLTELRTLNLSNSSPGNITGALPSSIGKLTKLVGLVLNRNKITGSIPVELTTIKTLNTIQMHTNLFTGNIPVEIGNLTALISLELNGNNFTGSLPVGAFGKLTLLNSCRVNGNKLTGEIPADMKSNPKWSGWTPATNICPQQATFGFTNCP